MPSSISRMFEPQTSQRPASQDSFSKILADLDAGMPLKEGMARSAFKQERAADVGTLAGTRFMDIGERGLESSLGYFEKLLSGDRQAMLEAVAPEVRTISSQYDAARKTIQREAPRGGGRSRAMVESRFAEASDIGNLLAASRREAAGKAAAIGSAGAAIGAETLTSSARQFSDVFGNLLAGKKFDYQKGVDLGRAIAGIIMTGLTMGVGGAKGASSSKVVT